MKETISHPVFKFVPSEEGLCVVEIATIQTTLRVTDDPEDVKARLKAGRELLMRQLKEEKGVKPTDEDNNETP